MKPVRYFCDAPSAIALTNLFGERMQKMPSQTFVALVATLGHYIYSCHSFGVPMLSLPRSAYQYRGAGGFKEAILALDGIEAADAVNVLKFLVQVGEG